MPRREYRAPGVYQERRVRRDDSISLTESGVPAFLGLTSRGPLDVPVRIHTYSEFEKTFGAPVSHSVLTDAIYGFFSNGGENCYVIRVAHKRGGKRDSEFATKASVTISDSQGRPSLRIEAANEGAWGNNIKVEVQVPDAAVKAFITLDVSKGDRRAVVKSARGFEQGTFVRIYDGTNEHFATLTKVGNKELKWRDIDASPFLFKSSAPTHIEPVEFDILVDESGRKEVFRGLSLSASSKLHPERLMVHASDLIRVTVLNPMSPISERLPAAVAQVNLGGGLDGLTSVTPADFIGVNDGPGHRYGLAALEANEDVDLVVAPDLVACMTHSDGFRGRKSVQIVQNGILSHCEAMMDRFAILDVPPDLKPEKALNWRLKFDSNFGAFYYPWIIVNTKHGQKVIPPSGHIAGVVARCDAETGPHRAPANEVVQGAVALQFSLDEEEVGYINAQGLNPIRVIPSRGIRIWGARTISSRPEWRYVSVRRVMNQIRRSVQHGTQWVVFETNNAKLWARLERHLKVFMQQLYEQGYFAGETTEQAFFVKCNAETNPSEMREAGQLVADLGIAPVRPAEFINFVLEQRLPEAG